MTWGLAVFVFSNKHISEFCVLYWRVLMKVLKLALLKRIWNIYLCSVVAAAAAAVAVAAVAVD